MSSRAQCLRIHVVNVAVAAAALLLPTVAASAVFRVDSPLWRSQPLHQDGDGCTLQKVVRNINAGAPYPYPVDCPPQNNVPNPHAGFDYVFFDLPSPRTIVLGDQLEVINGRKVWFDGYDGDDRAYPRLRLDGGKLSRMFRLADSQASVVFEQIEFWNGYTSGSGGAVLLERGDMEFRQVEFYNNLAAAGGAIANFDGFLILDGVRFNHNRATAEAGSGRWEGGALWTSGHTMITPGDDEKPFNSPGVFSTNVANDGGGAIRCHGGQLDIVQATFFENVSWGIANATAPHPPEPYRTHGGGAILTGNGCQLAVQFTRFLGNDTVGPGAAVMIESNNGYAHIQSSGFVNNSQTNAVGALDGGTIAAEATLLLSGSSIEANSAGGPGGGLVLRNLGPYVAHIANNVFFSNAARSRVAMGPTPFDVVEGAVLPGAAVYVLGAATDAVFANNTFVGGFGDSLFAVSGSNGVFPELRVVNNILSSLTPRGGMIGMKTCVGDVQAFAGSTFLANLEWPTPPAAAMWGCPDAVNVDPKLQFNDQHVLPGHLLQYGHGLPRASYAFGDSASCIGPPVLGVDYREQSRQLPCVVGAIDMP